ncbi:MAG TPA: thiamine-phosphate kinase, partial [Pyrinomonadaceae bacterium]|nr:thiamine-phosphate kinase [Pyrinomonadaceae bacterium]
EFDFIEQLRAKAGDSNTPELSLGIGDDAAIIKQFSGRDTLVTSDLLVEDIDFRRDFSPPHLLGHKALAVSLSDIAAMGGRPRWAVLSLGVPEDIWNSDFVTQFYEGLFGLARRYDVQLIGGDLSRTTGKIVIDSTVIGECASSQAVLRKGAQVGDQLFVTGSLGGSAAALRLLERGLHLKQNQMNDEAESIEQLLLCHLRPEPRVGWGLVLGEEGLASAMIDISDGLSSDIHHLCEESRVGALIESARIPRNEHVTALCGRRALDPLMLALHGGEDFELLFTVPKEKMSLLPTKVDGVSLTHIGEIRKVFEGIHVAEGSRTWELKPEGWQHFNHSQRAHGA